MSKIDIFLTKEGQFTLNVEIIKVNKDNPKDIKVLKIIKALIDTGATSSTISERVAKELNFEEISKRKIHTASGISEMGVYKMSILLDQANHPRPGPNNQPIFTGEKVAIDLTPSGFQNIGEIDMLIGMDILFAATIVINNGCLSLILH